MHSLNQSESLKYKFLLKMSSENKLFGSRLSWCGGDNVLSPSTNTFTRPKVSYLYKRSRGDSSSYIPLSKQIWNDSPNTTFRSKENSKHDSNPKPDNVSSQVIRHRIKQIRPGSHYKHSYVTPNTPDLPKELSVKPNSFSLLNDPSINKKSRRKTKLKSLPSTSQESSNPLLSKLLELRKDFSVKPIETIQPRVLRIVPRKDFEWSKNRGGSLSPAPAATHQPSSPRLLSTVESDASLANSAIETGCEPLSIKACPTLIKYRSTSVPRRAWYRSGGTISMETQTEECEETGRVFITNKNYSISEGESAEEESPGIRYTAKYSNYN